MIDGETVGWIVKLLRKSTDLRSNLGCLSTALKKFCAVMFAQFSSHCVFFTLNGDKRKSVDPKPSCCDLIIVVRKEMCYVIAPIVC